MIALTSLFHANSNKTNNIQSDHQQSRIRNMRNHGAQEDTHDCSQGMKRGEVHDGKQK